jgi:hypothetical protein
MIGIETASATRAVLDDGGLVRSQRRAVVGRHQHHHGGAGRLGAARAFRREPRGEVAARHDHRHAPGHVREAEVQQHIALVVRQRELLRVVGEDADAVVLLVDHAVEHAPLALEVDVAAVGERRRDDREHAGERSRHAHASTATVTGSPAP